MLKIRRSRDRLMFNMGIPVLVLGPFQYKNRLSRYGITMLKIRWSRDRLIFNMDIPILVSRHLYIEIAPWPLQWHPHVPHPGILVGCMLASTDVECCVFQADGPASAGLGIDSCPGAHNAVRAANAAGPGVTKPRELTNGTGEVRGYCYYSLYYTYNT